MSAAAVLVVVLTVVVLLLAAFAAWILRGQALESRVGAFRCAVSRTPQGPWTPGIGQFGAEHLYWWRRHSLRPRPDRRWTRRGMAVIDRTWAPPAHGLGTRGRDRLRGSAGVAARTGEHRYFVVRLRVPDVTQDVYLLVTPQVYAGLLSWIEATPSRVDSWI